MTGPEKEAHWLKRARSNLACARVGKISGDILFEDLCFDAQQAVEKALKALCVKNKVVFKKVHDIAYLIELLEKDNIMVSDEVQKAKTLTDYAVESRYPGDYEPVDEEMYKEAVEIAEKVVLWVEAKLKENVNEDHS